MRRPYEFARVQLTRFRPARGVCKHTVSTDSIVLLQLRRNRWHFKNNRRNLWSEVRWFRKSPCLSEQRTPRPLPTAMLKPRLRGAARRAHGSSARPKSTSSGDASHLRLGGARHARLNRVTRTVAKWFAQSTSEWPKTLLRGSNGGRSPLGLSFFHIFLQTKKDMATGGRWSRRAPGKNVKRKTQPPEVVGLAPRLVNTQNLKNPLRNSLRNLHSIRRGGHNPPRVPGPFPTGVQARN